MINNRCLPRKTDIQPSWYIMNERSLAFQKLSITGIMQEGTPDLHLTLHKIWNILQGLPKRVDMISSELALAYNCCISKVDIPNTTEENTHLQLQHLRKTLDRLCDFLGVFKMRDERTLYDIKYSIEVCIRRTKDSNILIPLSMLGIFVAISLIKEDKPADSQRLLQYLLDVLSSNTTHAQIEDEQFVIQINDKKHRLLLISPPDGSNHSSTVYVSDLMHIILAYLCLYNGELERSEKHTKCINSLSLQNVEFFYLKGVLLYKQGDIEGANAILQAWSKDKGKSSCYQADFWNLSGCLLAEQNKQHTAIQVFKEALKLDFDNVLPLFNIAQQYRKLHMVEAEQEIRNILISTIKQDISKDQQRCSSGTPGFLYVSSFGIHIGDKGKHSVMSLEQGLYSVSRHYLEMKSYEIAGTKYLDLLATITNSTRVLQAPLLNFSLPPADQIYLECAFCLMQSKQYEQCIAVCNRLIECCSQTNDGVIQLSSDVIHPHVKIGKRKRDLTSEDNSQTCQLEDDPAIDGISPRILGFVYKADALLMLARPQEALHCLDSTLSKMEPEYINTHENYLTECISVQPASKRIRLELDKSDCASSCSSADSKTHKAGRLFAQIYNKKSLILLALQRHDEALANSRLSVIISKGYSSYVYNHTLLLYKLSRHVEAAKTWLCHRGIQTPMESFQALNLIKRKKAALLSLGTDAMQDKKELFNSDLNDETLLNLDIVSLNVLLKRNTI